jgi:PEP-CTERM motif
MSAKKIKEIAVAAGLMAAASAAQAGFVPVDTVSPNANTIGIVSNNDFRTTLAGIGITTYTLGASLAVDQAGSVTYYYYGKEAGYQNIFTAGSKSYDSGFSPTSQSFFTAPKTIGTVDVLAGLLNFGFCSNSAPGVLVGCVTNAQNDALNLGSLQSIAFNATDSVAWLFWDDSGAGPDDNHDDMLIKAVFTPRSVPEPATLGLFGLGLLGLWTGARRRMRKA